MIDQEAPTGPNCACHGRPWAKCPVFGPLYTEQNQETAGSRPATTPSAAHKEKETMPKKAKSKPAAGETGKHVIHRRQYEKEVRIGLGEEDRDGFVKDLTNALKDHEELQAEAKEVAAGYRQKLTDLNAKIRETRLTLTEGAPTMRLVEEIRNETKGTITIKDVETGQVYEDRDMDEHDAQVPLAGEEDENDGGDDQEDDNG